MSNTTRFNEELVSLVRSGKLAIENTDYVKMLLLMQEIRFPKDLPQPGFKYYWMEDNYWTAANKTNLPTCPVSDFFLPTVSDGEEEDDEFELKYCDYCKQMTNHLYGSCQKCYLPFPSPTSAHLKTGSEDGGFEVEHDPFGVGKKPQKYVITGGDYEMVKPDTISCEVLSICEGDDEWFEFVMYLTGYKKEQVERQIANWKRNIKQ